MQPQTRARSPIAIGALLLLTAGCASAKPRWVEHVPRGYEYEYVVGAASDSNRAAARGGAIASAMARAAEERDVRYQVSRRDSLVHEERIAGHGERVAESSQRYSGALAIISETPEMIARDLRVVDEYWGRSSPRAEVWVLMRRPRPEGGRPAPGAASLALRSAVVPGWGQLVKQQPRRGAALMGLIAVAIPSVMILDASRADAALRSRRAMTPAVRTFWRDRANLLGSARAGTLGVAGTAYLYGIVDAGT